MRRAAAILLVLVAALAAPLRQACGTTCVHAPVAATVRVPTPEASSDAASCHKPEPAPEPEPAATHCTHDHSGSLRPAFRAATVEASNQPALFEAAPVFFAPLLRIEVASASTGLSPGSPPLRILPLRI